MKKQSTEKFQKFVQQMPEVLICESDEYKHEFFEDLKSRMLSSLIANKDTAIITKLERLFIESHLKIASRCIDGAAAEPYAVICHGDCWNNNILFKNDEVQNLTTSIQRAI